MDDLRLSPRCKFVYKNGGITIEWKTGARNILVVHKFCDDKVIDDMKILLTFVLKNWDASVFLGVETVNELRKDPLFIPILNRYMCVNRNDPTALSAADTPKNSSIIVFDCTRADDIDLVVCLGGDGTLLKIGSMFQRVVPPVIAFCLGTLGFLAPFSFTSFESILKHAIEGSPNCLMRMRLCCHVVRNVPQESSVVCSPDDPPSNISASRSISPDTEYHFLNELVIDRGLSPSSCDLVVKVNGKMVTHFEGDGLIVSTPTGSTAYSMATGASMLHPCVPAFLLTPINSLTLSSRAIVLPMSMQLEISINPAARCKVAHFSFDGRSRECNMINKGDAILVSGSPYPMPCISGSDQQVDWFCGLNHLLNWNTRNKRADLHDCLDCSDMATA